ncbi:hypothetical protein ['Camptotheca acuminata' phytoplasma]|uniref:hypothetical protein n=1 Tax='Camptotheca acuminata' phytoplasma TaxID=3239192 RepID=UPI00351A0432
MSFLKNNYNINNENNQITEEDNLISEIKKIESFLKKNIFLDIEQQFISQKRENDYSEEQEKLDQNFINLINALNIKHNNILNIINKKKHIQKLNTKTNEEKDYINLIISIVNKIKKKKIEKKKIYREFKTKNKHDDKEFYTKTVDITNIEKKISFKKENLKKIFLKEELNLSKKIIDIIDNIKKKIKQKDIHLTAGTKKIQKKQKHNLILTKQKYEANLKKIQKGQEKTKKEFLKKIQDHNLYFQNKFIDHNKILNQIQEDFFKQEKQLIKLKTKLFEEKKLKIFFVFDYKNPSQYKTFSSLINKNKQNQAKYLKNLNSWQKRYFFLKFLHQTKLNIINIEEKQKEKQNNLEIKQNLFLEQQEIQKINNQFTQDVIYLKNKNTLDKIKKKYQVLNTEIQEEQKKNDLKYNYYSEKSKIDLVLNNLDYQKKKITFESTKLKKKKLLENQLKTELIKLDSEYLEKSIQNLDKIQDFNVKLTNLINNQYKQTKIQEVNFEEQKQYFFKRTEITFLQQQNNIKKYEFIQKNSFQNIDLFLENITQTRQKQNELFQTIYQRINKYKDSINNKKKIFLIEEFRWITDLCELFLNNIQNKQLNYDSILIEKINNLEQLNLNKNINWFENIRKYSEKNIFHINALISKYKLKNKKKYKYIENKLKNYEKIHLYLKKQKNLFQTKQNQKKLKQEKIISQLKKNQDQYFKKYDFYKKKILFYLSRSYELPKKKNFYQKISFWFYNKKKSNYWKKFWNILNYLTIISNRKYNYFLKKFNFLKTDIAKQDEKFLLKNKQKAQLLFDSFSKIIEQIHSWNKEILEKKQKEEKDKLNNQITFYKNHFETELKIRTKKKELIKENFKEALSEVNNYFQEKINQAKKNKLNKEKDLQNEINNKKYLLKKKNTILKRKTFFFQKEQQKEEAKYQKRNKKNNILAKKEKRHKCKMKIILFYYFLQKFFSLQKTKIIFFIRKFKKKIELKQNNYYKKRKFNKKIKMQLFFYNKFDIYL